MSHKENFRSLSNPADYRKFQVASPNLWLLWQDISKDNFIVKMHEARKTAAHDAHFPASFSYIQLLQGAYSIYSYGHIHVLFKQVTLSLRYWQDFNQCNRIVEIHGLNRSIGVEHHFLFYCIEFIGICLDHVFLIVFLYFHLY